MDKTAEKLMSLMVMLSVVLIVNGCCMTLVLQRNIEKYGCKCKEKVVQQVELNK